MPVYDLNGNILSQSQYDVEWKRGTLNTNGTIAIDDYALTGLISAVINAKTGLIISAPSPYTIRVAYYDTLDSTGFTSITPWGTSLTVPKDTFLVVALKKTDSSAIELTEGQKCSFNGDYEIYSESEKPSSLDVYWKLERMRWTSEQFVNLLSGYPLTTGNISANQTVYGVPYSSATHTEGMVNIDISMYTYLSAVRNPNSVIYTDINSNYARRAYYGIDCSGLACGGFGLHDNIPTALQATRTDLFDVVDDPNDIQLGDLIWKTGHCAPIMYIERDKFGRIVFVGVNEGKDPLMKHHLYYWTEFLSRLSTDSATIRRFKQIDDVMFDSPLDYQFRGDPVLNFTFPDITTSLGDKVTVLTGTTVSIQVLTSTGYSSIKVYRDGTLIDTKNTVANFTISADTVGHYEVRMEGTGKQSSCFFNVASLTLSITGNVATFTANGVTPYTIYPTKNHASSGGDKQDIHFLTAEEISNGSATIASMVSYATTNSGCIKLKAYDEFGTVFAYVDF